MTDAAADFARWCAARDSALRAPDSWLGLIGLHWLEAGDNVVGTAADAAVPLPEGPARLGSLRVAGSQIVWVPAGGDAQALTTDAGGTPTVVTHGTLAFFVIERSGRLAVRVRDLDWAAKLPFTGIERFPYDPAWCIDAEWTPLEPPRTMEVPDVCGELKTVAVRWQARFRVGDQAVALLPMNVSDRGAFFVFRDASSGRQTYGAGRFLETGPAVDGRLRLDFNRAINPPCAFTPFATCPLPPPENCLSFPIAAGERKLALDRMA